MLYGVVGGIREITNYSAIDILFTIVNCFIDLMTGYSKYPKMVRVLVMYASFMNRVISGDWSQHEKAKNRRHMVWNCVSLERGRGIALFCKNIRNIHNEAPLAESFGRGSKEDLRYITSGYICS